MATTCLTPETPAGIETGSLKPAVPGDDLPVLPVQPITPEGEKVIQTGALKPALPAEGIETGDLIGATPGQGLPVLPVDPIDPQASSNLPPIGETPKPTKPAVGLETLGVCP